MVFFFLMYINFVAKYFYVFNCISNTGHALALLFRCQRQSRRNSNDGFVLGPQVEQVPFCSHASFFSDAFGCRDSEREKNCDIDALLVAHYVAMQKRLGRPFCHVFYSMCGAAFSSSFGDRIGFSYFSSSSSCSATRLRFSPFCRSW